MNSDKDGNKKPHIMVSYSWNNKDLVDTIYSMLMKECDILEKYNFWIDSRNLTTGILRRNLEKAVANSVLVLVFLSRSYAKSVNCKIEADYIIKNNISFIPIIVEEGFPYDNVFINNSQNISIRVKNSPLLRRRENKENIKTMNWIKEYFSEYLYIDMSGVVFKKDAYENLVENIKYILNIKKKYKETKPEENLKKDKVKIQRRLSHEETQDFRDLIRDTPRTASGLCHIFDISLGDAIEIIKEANKDFNPTDITIS